MSEDVEDLLAYCKSNKRICPMPDKWDELWKMLPGRSRVGSAWEPSLPLILAAWHNSPALSKMLRLQEHIHWADKTGALESVGVFLRRLREEDWAHIDV